MKGSGAGVARLAKAALTASLALVLGACGSAEEHSPAAQDAATGSEEVVVSEQVAPASQFASLVQEGQVSSIRLLGDSITAGYLCDGYGVPSDTGAIAYDGPEGTYLETATTVRCWANDFRSWAADQGVTSFTNAGVSGFRMSYLAEAPDAWLGDGADVIVVMLGTNDAAKESQADFEAAAREGLAAAAARCRLLVVVSPPDNQRTDATNRYGMDEVDQILSKVCEEEGYEHVSLLDVLEVGTDDLNPDQVHPTTAGSDKLWEAFREREGL